MYFLLALLLCLLLRNKTVVVVLVFFVNVYERVHREIFTFLANKQPAFINFCYVNFKLYANFDIVLLIAPRTGLKSILRICACGFVGAL